MSQSTNKIVCNDQDLATIQQALIVKIAQHLDKGEIVEAKMTLNSLNATLFS